MLKSTSGTGQSSAVERPGRSQLRNSFLRVDSRSRVQLYVQLSDAGAASIAALQAAGRIEIELVNQDLKTVQAWVPYDQIEAVAALAFVQSVRAPDYGVFHAGSVTTEGDTILKTNTVRSTLGFTGAGVKVGVISGGANDAAESQATGDLPASITTFGSCDATMEDCTEGAAILEIVYDIAPGATLAMADANTSLDFLQRLNDLISWGAKVIVDDIGFFAEPFFADGPLATAYANAVAQGIVVVSAAGNEGQGHYQGMFVATGQGFHDFSGGAGTILLPISIPPLELATVELQWSDPFGAAADNYDLCALNLTGTTIVTCSTNPQSGTQDPIEGFSLACFNPTVACKGSLRIQKVSGAAQTLELTVFGFGSTLTSFASPKDGIFGHAAAADVISVGAISASDPGNLDIDTYSSQGPSTILFPTPQQRATPTLTAVDCVTVSRAGGFSSPFCGTSAAAPHVAGIVALMLQAKPSLTPAQVSALLSSTSADRGSPGYDNVFGAGLANGLDAVMAELGNPVPAITSLSPMSATRGSAGFTLTVNGSNFISGSTVRWNGSDRPTTFVSATQLTAMIAASDIASPSSLAARVTVFTSAPGGGTSNTLSFSIPNPAPTLTSLSPSSAIAGGAAFALTAAGSNFSPDSVIQWNGSPLLTSTGTATQLTALVPASDIAAVGTVQVTVFTPTPGGGTSAAVAFPITASTAPTFTAASLVNGASFTGPTPAPGAIASVFGTNLASGQAFSSGLPLKTTLNGTSVTVNNIPAPLFFVSSSQINFQIPWEVAAGASVPLSVSVDSGFSNTTGVALINLSAIAPGIFSLNSQGTGQGAILISNTATYAAPADSVPGSSARPANRGEFITIYCSGLGTVSNPPASGAPAGSSPLSSTVATPIVTIGGIQLTPSFSGLSPGFVGLYQVDFPVPNNAPTGNAIPVTLSIGGVSTNTVTVAIQ